MHDFIIFTFNSVLATASILFFLFSRKVIISVLWLLMFFFATAVYFALLEFPFLAIGQILVFVGGIIVVILLALSFIDISQRITDFQKLHILYLVSIFLFFLILINAFSSLILLPPGKSPDFKDLVKILFSQYGILINLIAAIFLSSMVGLLYILKISKRT